MALTARQCDTATCPPNQDSLILFNYEGLSLRITRKTNSKLWLWHYTFNKKRTQMSIGSFTDLTLAEARAERDRLRGILLTGVNPKIAKLIKINEEIKASGHSNMATTQRYIDLRPAMLKAAVELV